MTIDLPTYILLNEATRRYRVGAQALTQMIEKGTIRAVRVNGSLVVAEEDVSIAAVQIDPDLRGKPIRLVDAAERYNISDTNLVRWAEAGYIHIIKRGPKLLMLDEADVKRAVELFKVARQKTGSYVKAGWILRRALLQAHSME